MKTTKEFRKEIGFPRSAVCSIKGQITTDDLMRDYAEYYHKEQLKLLNKHFVVGRSETSEQYCSNCGDTKWVYSKGLTEKKIKCPECC